MNRLKWIFVSSDRRLRAGWRVVLFMAIYIAAGKGLDVALAKIHFPDRAFTWSHGRELIFYAMAWAVAMLALGFGE